jgi:hypothetical protein
MSETANSDPLIYTSNMASRFTIKLFCDFDVFIVGTNVNADFCY